VFFIKFENLRQFQEVLNVGLWVIFQGIFKVPIRGESELYYEVIEHGQNKSR